MSGDGLCVDAANNLYLESGNGSFSAYTNGGDYGDSFVKLSSSNQLAVADYFAPSNQNSMALNDEDLGSGGPILLPDAVGSVAHPHLLVGAGKEGTIYLVDRDNMGQFNPTQNNIVQTLPGAIRGVWGSPAYFNNLLFYQGVGDVLKAFRITNAVIGTTPVSQSTTRFGGVGYTPSISANGTTSAIAWVDDTDGFSSNGPSVLHAYNATNLAQELYNSSQNLLRDNPGPAVKYAVPMVANGKVYVRGEYTLSVFGLINLIDTPVISPDGGVFFTNLVTVALSDGTAGATTHYTLDNTLPTTNSPLYDRPFVVTNTATVKARAFESGFNDSAVASASFILGSAPQVSSVTISSSHSVLLSCSGISGQRYVLQASVDLMNWIALSTNVAAANQFDLSDPTATNYSDRFYRLLELP
ncbi:PA14 domain protein (fragment) [Verrucomicrobia bacterium]